MNLLKSFWHPLDTPTATVNNFTPRSQQVLALARNEADRLHHHFVGTEHVLLGLIGLAQGTAVNVLLGMGVNLEAARAEVERQVGVGPDQKMIGNIPYTPRVKRALALAAKEARDLQHSYVGTEHLLLGLLREGDGVAARVLTNLGVHAEAAREQILRELDPHHVPSPADAAAVPIQVNQAAPEAVDVRKRYDVFCREGDQEVIYENACFKNVRALLKQREDDYLAEYVELEQANGQTVFVARFSIIKFREHGGGAAE